MSDTVVIKMFSEAKVALMKEVRDHWPELGKQLIEQESKEWPDQLGTIAAYCNILMDGMYSPGQLEDLTDKLVWKLREKRGAIVIKSGPIGVPISEYGKPDPTDPKKVH